MDMTPLLHKPVIYGGRLSKNAPNKNGGAHPTRKRTKRGENAPG